MAGFTSLSAIDIALWLTAVGVLSIFLTWCTLFYARQRLLDLPGQRRSHVLPTPRGGGIGLCVAGIAGLIAMGALTSDVAMPTRLIAAIALIAVIGWIDDHRPLPITARLIPQVAATILFLWPIVAQTAGHYIDPDVPTSTFVQELVLILVLIGLGMWSINLHNFMDGIDGILASQAVFVLSVLGWLCARDQRNPHGMEIGLFAVATLGFLPFNFPRARIFMGDVGSGTLGLVIFIAAMWQFYSPYSAEVSAVVVGSAFVTDATCTLFSRMLRGRRWYAPHREHLYQWMTRTGLSHARVSDCYAAWNLFVVLPIIALVNLPALRSNRTASWIVAAAVYLVAIVVWICGKRWCLYKVQIRDMSRTVHANA
jgi:UDP-N-acetylmuramyl pentapeptide phosphotransferase/UDP-N-acetylglucosamine-1-phosphate transferase